ncbi:MAG TPA: alpha/beta fold hydrolase [Gaiellaceae bacterium]|nr:alpha/beta fold hydrolase [Gaiellaceae bacterium]
MSLAAPVLASDPPLEIYADDGLELHYRAFVPDGAARGSLVYLHGIQSHGGWYIETAAELARRGYAVYLPDRRGSGESLAPRGDFDGPAQLVADVHRFVKLARREHPDAPVVLVGGCWGARTALQYALDHPYELAALGLIGPALKAKVDLEPAEKLAVFRGRLREPERRIRIPLEAEMFTSNPPYLDFIREDPLSLHEVTARFYFEQFFWDRKLLATTKLAMPVLLLQAGRDPIVDGESVRRWFEQLSAPAKQYIRYPDFGHILDFEPERDRYRDDLAGWLDRVVSESPVARRAGPRRASIAAIDLLAVELPFRFSFGHALATRSSSTNVVARVVLEDGTVGYGESVPRDYVTGETTDGALAALAERQVPALLGLDPGSADELGAAIDEAAPPVGPDGRLETAARCALELGLLDAFGRWLGLSVQAWLGGEAARQVRYDAVLPFSSPRKVAILARVIKAYGVSQVKVKVGDDLERELETLAILRRLLGPTVDLRVDANCGWTVEEALEAIERMRAYKLSAVEQPLAADDLEGLARLTAEVPESIVVDESLRTVADAEKIVEAGACNAFNIRVSKCGGLLASMRIARIAQAAGLDIVVGAQVGESGLLSAAGRHLAAAIGQPRYVEGSGGSLLLKEDLTAERVLPGYGGWARTPDGPGLGVHVRTDVLERHTSSTRTLEKLPKPKKKR